jgi:ribonucleoside-diphosphate reductase alpha chain
VDDDTMRSAKAGAWWEDAAQRAMANNSAVYTEKPSIGTFLAEWKALYDSGSGERGLFSRAAAQRQAARNGRRDATQPFGTNPCW